MNAKNSIYTDDQITVTAELIESGPVSFPVRSLDSVCLVRQGKLALLYLGAGLFALMFGGTMASFGGMLLGSMSEFGPDKWADMALGIAAGGVALIAMAKHLPPIAWYVRITAGWQRRVVYVTSNEDDASAVESAIKAAIRGGE
jgi:hypothetical protein